MGEMSGNKWGEEGGPGMGTKEGPKNIKNKNQE